MSKWSECTHIRCVTCVCTHSHGVLASTLDGGRVWSVVLTQLRGIFLLEDAHCHRSCRFWTVYSRIMMTSFKQTRLLSCIVFLYERSMYPFHSSVTSQTHMPQLHPPRHLAKKIPRSCVSNTLQTRPPSSVDADAPCECSVSQSARTHTSHTGCVCTQITWTWLCTRGKKRYTYCSFSHTNRSFRVLGHQCVVTMGNSLIWISLCMFFFPLIETVTYTCHYLTDRLERFDLKTSKLDLLKKKRLLHLGCPWGKLIDTKF